MLSPQSHMTVTFIQVLFFAGRRQLFLSRSAPPDEESAIIGHFAKHARAVAPCNGVAQRACCYRTTSWMSRTELTSSPIVVLNLFQHHRDFGVVYMRYSTLSPISHRQIGRMTQHQALC